MVGTAIPQFGRKTWPRKWLPMESAQTSWLGIGKLPPRVALQPLIPVLPPIEHQIRAWVWAKPCNTIWARAYTLPLHFLGHSLGTLVNASAIDFVHGEKPGTSPQASWSSNLIHVTLFDQALLAEALGIGEIQTPLPLHFTWADNYKSLVDWHRYRGR